MTSSFPLRLFLCGAATLTLGACDSMRETFGLNRHAPDEFAVATRAPLDIPKEFNLYPPTPGAPRPQDRPLDLQAKMILTGEAAEDTANPSSSESALLNAAGADTANPAIRAKISTDKQEERDPGAPTINRILDIGSAQTGKGTVIDPRAEAERLKKEGLMK